MREMNVVVKQAAESRKYREARPARSSRIRQIPQPQTNDRRRPPRKPLIARPANEIQVQIGGLLLKAAAKRVERRMLGEPMNLPSSFFILRSSF